MADKKSPFVNNDKPYMCTKPVQKMLCQLADGYKYTTMVNNEVLEYRNGLPAGTLKQIPFAMAFVTLCNPVEESPFEYDHYYTIVFPENDGLGLSEIEIGQIILHEIGHVRVEGALGIGMDVNDGLEYELLADTYVNNPDAMISALTKIYTALMNTPITEKQKEDFRFALNTRVKNLRNR